MGEAGLHRIGQNLCDGDVFATDNVFAGQDVRSADGAPPDCLRIAELGLNREWRSRASGSPAATGKLRFRSLAGRAPTS